MIGASPVGPRYDQTVDRASAYERLVERSEPAAEPEPPPAAKPRGGSVPTTRAPRASTRASAGERLVGNLAASVGREIGRQLIRGVLGTLLKGSRR